MTAIQRAAAALLVMTAFVWPALYNGQPFFFPDTTAYIRGADAGIQAAFKHRSAWSVAADGQKSVSSIEEKTVLTGRSPYYGALLYLGDWTGGFWLTVVTQAAALLGAITLALRAVRITWWPYGSAIALCVAVATAAPFFASLLMPDVFAGIAILTAAVLLSTRAPLPRGEWLLALVLLAASAAFHDSHVLILLAIASLGLAHAFITRQARHLRGIAVIGVALLVGFAAQAMFYAVVKRVVGATPLRPPFLMARTIEDGPGLAYIRATCPGNGFKVCDFADRLPLIADDFLWKLGPSGVFASASPAVRRQLSDEQVRFLLAVIAYDPAAQLTASFKDAAAQLTQLKLTEFSYTDQEKTGFAAKIPATHRQALEASAAYRGSMPLGLFEPWTATIAVAALIALLAALVMRARLGVPPAVLGLACWVSIGVAINAGVCGILSGPHDRYSVRVAWLLPFVALLVAAKVRAARSRGALDA